VSKAGKRIRKEVAIAYFPKLLKFIMAYGLEIEHFRGLMGSILYYNLLLLLLVEWDIYNPTLINHLILYLPFSFLFFFKVIKGKERKDCPINNYRLVERFINQTFNFCHPFLRSYLFCNPNISFF
jgi:hypothetical protein